MDRRWKIEEGKNPPAVLLAQVAGKSPPQDTLLSLLLGVFPGPPWFNTQP